MAGGDLPDNSLLLEHMLRAGLVAQLDTSSLITGQLRVELDLRPGVTTASTQTVLGLPEIPTVASLFEFIKARSSSFRCANWRIPRNVPSTASAAFRISLTTGSDHSMDSVQKTSDGAHDTLRVTTDAVRQINEASTNTLGDFDRLAVEGQQQLTDRGADLSRVLTDADRTVHEVKTLSASLNDMLAPRSHTRGNFDAAFRDLAATSNSLRDFSREIDRDPSLLLSRGVRL